MTKNEQLLEAMKTLKDAWKAVNNFWSDIEEEDSELLANDYPFEDSFDEYVENIEQWYNSANKNLTK